MPMFTNEHINLLINEFAFRKALDLMVKKDGPIAVINTTQSLGRMPYILAGNPLMTLTLAPECEQQHAV